MKAFIIDHDEVTTNLLRSRLEPMDFDVSVDPSKDQAIARLAGTPHDVIFVDPAPLMDVDGFVRNLRRKVGNYPYIFLMSEDQALLDGQKSAVNDTLLKPLDPENVKAKIRNAERMSALVAHIGDDSQDFPNAGGVIAKSAFNQLFLSGIERGRRYSESSFVLFIGISNYQDIRKFDGPYAADYAVAKLSQHLVGIRRQSDIIGQTSASEYALLILLPVGSGGPDDAARRFAESLAAEQEIISNGMTQVEISISLVELPTGVLISEYVLQPGESVSASA